VIGSFIQGPQSGRERLAEIVLWPLEEKRGMFKCLIISINKGYRGVYEGFL